MTSSRTRVVRRAGFLTFVLLLTATIQAAPAAADPGEPWHAAISISTEVVYPADDAAPGPAGTSKDAPADAGPEPGTLSVRVVIRNTGTDPLTPLNVVGSSTPDGHPDDVTCEPMEGTPFPVLIGDPDFTLYQGQTLTCTQPISMISHGTTHEVVTTVLAGALNTGETVRASDHVWAEAGPPAPPPPPVSVGHLVWLDTNRNYRRDDGEPGIPGVALSLQLECCQPTPESGPVFLDTTTDEHGEYHFRGLEPGFYYRVTIDLLRSPTLAGLAPWAFPLGTDGLGTRFVQFTTDALLEDDDSIDFGFVPTHPLVVDIDAPTSAVAGTTIDVKGRPYRPDQPEVGHYNAVLEFRAGGTTTWTKVADANGYYTDEFRHVQVKVTRSGWFRYRSPGDGLYVSPGVSREAHVLVTLAPVALTAAAPSTVRPGAPLTVAGTITRAGRPFKTGRIVLERSSDAKTWTTVADVRSTDGTLKATVEPARTGSYRFRYAGDSRSAPAMSPSRSVVVSLAAVKGSAPPARR